MIAIRIILPLLPLNRRSYLDPSSQPPPGGTAPFRGYVPSLRASLGRKLGHIMAGYVDGLRP
jgi:hypothetical protein